MKNFFERERVFTHKCAVARKPYAPGPAKKNPAKQEEFPPPNTALNLEKNKK